MLRIVCRLVAVASLAVGLPIAPARAQDADIARTLETCRAIVDTAARLRCFESATSRLRGNPAPAPPPNPSVAPPAAGPLGDWRLLRTPNPSGGDPAVSVIHTADLAKSDVDFAGLMIRCTPAVPEVLVVLITPFTPRAHPQVTIRGTGAEVSMEARVMPPGTLLLLPADATALAVAWQSVAEISIKVTNEGTAVQGVVSIQGLPAALATLIAECPRR